ncbi:MAG: pyridoxamine 5'-phosphate oxidase [Bacteroidales bacterium]|nr:pyridoxamine 5'-phosphate oxidase [Bacteroidales bacterium]
MSANFLKHFRREYLSSEMNESDMLEDPFRQFMEWLEDATRSGIDDPNAMALATVDRAGQPSVRMVLLKDAREEGFVFYTNYESRKGQELEQNPNAAIMFFWPGLDRQIRIEGKIERTSADESDEFFDSRPLNSRISAVISPQSKVIPGRDFLEEKFNHYGKPIDDQNLKRPDHWGGFILKPHRYEFWQGRESRLNDRIQYIKVEDEWSTSRLAP